MNEHKSNFNNFLCWVCMLMDFLSLMGLIKTRTISKERFELHYQKEQRRMTGYCKYCDTLTDDIVRDFNDNHNMVWSGCLNCYKKRIG